jgi:transcriptional regulator with XRE-family HTH domain
MDMKIDPLKIKQLREARGWSQEHLAEVAGLSPRTVQRIEAESNASPESRMALAAALGRPNFTLSTGIAPRLALVRFVWSRRFRELGDPSLSLCCRAAMTAEPLLVVLFGILIFGT